MRTFISGRTSYKYIRYGITAALCFLILQYCVSFTYVFSVKNVERDNENISQFDPDSFVHLLTPEHVNYSDSEQVNKSNPSAKSFCEFPPTHLHTREKVLQKTITINELEAIHNNSQTGGRFTPSRCSPLSYVAIIVPYRDRHSNFMHFLYYLIPKLKRQNIDFTIYLIEQNGVSNFNRGMLRNIGFHEAKKVSNYSCYIFNDVDTIPEDDRNLYLCNKKKIRHYVTGLDRERYRLPYMNLLGGIIGFTSEQFTRVNGYSNLYFQWGAEDDDLCRRIMKAELSVERPPHAFGFVTTLKHKNSPRLNKRMTMYRTVHVIADKDGLNSLKYKIVSYEKKPLYTHIKVDINEYDVMKIYNNIPKKLLEKGKEGKACSPIAF